jgi:hypothetical protein
MIVQRLKAKGTLVVMRKALNSAPAVRQMTLWWTALSCASIIRDVGVVVWTFLEFEYMHVTVMPHKFKTTIMTRDDHDL